MKKNIVLLTGIFLVAIAACGGKSSQETEARAQTRETYEVEETDSESHEAYDMEETDSESHEAYDMEETDSDISTAFNIEETDTEDGSMSASGYETISADQAKELMDSETNYVILDVREEDEYDEGHIEGAIQLSYTEIDESAEELLPDKDQLILVYCRSGRRSAIAACSLADLGYTNVKDFGGIIDWPYEVVE